MIGLNSCIKFSIVRQSPHQARASEQQGFEALATQPPGTLSIKDEVLVAFGLAYAALLPLICLPEEAKQHMPGQANDLALTETGNCEKSCAGRRP